MKIRILLERDGEVCRLKQPVSPTGIPRCVQCGRPIPKSYREWREKCGKRTLFCTDSCARSWAIWAAEQVYPAQAEVPKDASGAE